MSVWHPIDNLINIFLKDDNNQSTVFGDPTFGKMYHLKAAKTLKELNCTDGDQVHF